MAYRIPFNKPYQSGAEIEYLRQAMEAGAIGGDGAFCRRSEQLLIELLGVEKVLLTTSCTHALEMAGLLLDIQPGDEVIAPSFTFVSTVNAFVLRGARPVFVDVRPDTCNLDERLIEQHITPRTRAILPVHYAGVACEMDTILDVASRHGVSVVEDNAHGLGGRYKQRYLGTMGRLATQSFHETKNLSCGEGGALLVNDPSLVERAEIIREKGTDRTRFLRGQVDKYTWVDLGSSYVLSDGLGAVLCAQLEAYEDIQRRRRAIWERYASSLASWAREVGAALPCVPDGCEQSYHMFYIMLPTGADRDRLIQQLARRGILAVFHYVPLDSSPMGQRFGAAPCPVTADVSRRLLRLPFFTGMTRSEQDDVIEAVTATGA
ncbi:MAG: dTDP-4-amino-4,6-dideoxygalactose transaminase [Coriobacteriia bacterium]